MGTQQIGSLIDFDGAPDPPTTATQATGPSQSVVQPTSSSSADNWAFFDCPAENNETQPPTLNTLESLLSGLPVSAPVSNVTMFPPASAPTESPFGFGAFGVAKTNNLVSPLPPNGMNTHPVVANGGLPSMPPQLSSGFPASGIQSTSQPYVQQVGGDSSNQDLFAPSYPYPVRSPVWPAGPLHGFPYNIQYNAPRPMQSVPQLSKSTNPFDFSNDLAPTQSSTFPSMAPLQGSLPNIGAPTNTLHNSEAWMPSQSSYPLAMSLPAQSFASAIPPSAYMGQQMPNNLFPGQGLGDESSALGSKNPNQQLGGMFYPPVTHDTFSAAGGNPFGGAEKGF